MRLSCTLRHGPTLSNAARRVIAGVVGSSPIGGANVQVSGLATRVARVFPTIYPHFCATPAGESAQPMYRRRPHAPTRRRSGRCSALARGRWMAQTPRTGGVRRLPWRSAPPVASHDPRRLVAPCQGSHWFCRAAYSLGTSPASMKASRADCCSRTYLPSFT